MDKDIKKYMDELKKEIKEDIKEQNNMGRRDEYGFNAALKELHQKMDDVIALNSYDYGVEKYYILTERSQDLINDIMRDFRKNIKNACSFPTKSLCIDGWELQGSDYFIEAKEGYLKIYLDKPNNSVLIYNEPIKRGFNFVFDYSNKSLHISKIR